MPSPPNTVLVAALVAAAGLMAGLAAFSDVQGAVAPVRGPAAPDGTEPRARARPPTALTGLHARPDRISVVLPELSEPEPKLERSLEDVYAGWPRDSLESRAAALREEFFTLLDREARRRFDEGRYVAYQEGQDWRAKRAGGGIQAVRKTPLGWYERADIEPGECPELYRVHAEIVWLDAAVAARD